MKVQSEFKPAWWLRNRHLQTIVPRFYKVPCDFTPIREEFELSDGDFVELVWTQKPTDPEQPIVLILHGLEGSIDSFYAKRMMNAVHQQGWIALLMHFRGCGEKVNRKAQSYHSGQTQDVTELVGYLNQKYAEFTKYAIGFSLGGNVLTKYVGEQTESGLAGSVVISAPLDLQICAKAIGEGFSKVYQKYLVDKLIHSTQQKISQFKDKFPLSVSQEMLEKTKVLIDFDNMITAPLNGFKNAQDYYRKCSGNQFLKSCKTPTLIIHAKDDPFMTEAVIPSANMLSPNVRLEVSERGGHVGFLSGLNPFKPEFWTETRSIRFIQEMLARR